MRTMAPATGREEGAAAGEGTRLGERECLEEAGMAGQKIHSLPRKSKRARAFV
jgi:hypothetical protein